MTFITTSLPNNGKTSHFAVSYDDTLSKADGHDQAQDLFKHCEDDLTLIGSWFPGIGFIFDFPIGVQITGQSGGASWEDPSDIQRWFGFNPTVTIKPGPHPVAGLIRYLLVSEVTEMYMASQQKQWFESTDIFNGADEGSMGESLSRFLASEFLSARGISSFIYPGFSVANIWLNNTSRPDVIDLSPDDNKPDSTTGGGVLFLNYLKYQLNKSIQDIVGAAAGTLGGVYSNLTGNTNGWSSFKMLVDSHYPLGVGLNYSPPMDNVFPVAELSNFMAPFTLSWVENDPNVVMVMLSHSIPVNVDVMLTSDDPTTISLPAKVTLNSGASVNLNVPVQPINFVSKVVNLTATYAGKMLKSAVKIVRPEDLPVTPLEISLILGSYECADPFVEGRSVRFRITNPNVVRDHTGLTYKWTITGAVAPITDQTILEIPSLPPEGTTVIVEATITNAFGIHSIGTFEFTTRKKLSDLQEAIRRVECEIAHMKYIDTRIPWRIPPEDDTILPSIEEMINIEKQAKQLTVVARRVIESIKEIQASDAATEIKKGIASKAPS